MTSLNPVLTVGRQIGEVLRRHQQLRGAAAARRATELLDLVGIPLPARRLSEYPHQLSGGMRQRVMIAMAVACRAPAARRRRADHRARRDRAGRHPRRAAGPAGRDRHRGAADHPRPRRGRRPRRPGRGHVRRAARSRRPAPRRCSPGTATRTPGGCSRRCRTRSGGPAGSREIPGRVPTLRSSPDACTFADRCGRADSLCRSRPPGAAARPGRAPGALLPPAAAAGGVPVTPALEVVDLVKHFGAVRAVDGVSLTVAAGEVLGLVGESGSGKTHARPLRDPAGTGDRGAVRINGTDISRPARRRLRPLRRDFNIVFQDPASSLNPRMTVADIVGEPLRLHRIGDRAEPARPGRRRCWTRSACGPRSAAATRTSSPAASGSGSAWPGRCPRGRPCSWPTSRPPRSTCRCRRRCSTSSAGCRPSSASPACSSPTTWPRWSSWPSGSR